ncbi:Hsp20 family protein [Alcanivorax sp. 1008]|uniref:Hsp20 family protein n=1 Tax=Alcanivorax sp. 1008 TaxID=2816853 RepID=UPI001D42A292|nr:Hsp20 family protein [Alcanivorax sp. 1008]MCC1497609.1 Hsp20 family protein [Alcanivorax sp. 1008]
MNSGFSLAPLFRHSVGFDRFDDLINNALRADQSGGYPPYDIIRDADGQYRIVMAVAGFRESELNITVQENELRVSGRVEVPTDDEGDRTWLHRGIARRAFERTFRLADHVRVTGAGLKDGLLTVQLEQVVPEEAKPRMVPIQSE